MKIYLTSDLHFFHKNIIKYCPESRGHYTSVDEMNQDIVDKFNSLVKEEDKTYILGDLSFGPVKATMEFLMSMNGTKVIIHGNHDRSFIQSPDYLKYRHMAGIEEDAPYKVITHGKAGVVLFHFPIESWDGAFHGSYHLHGHVHSTKAQRASPGLRRMDIGVDGNDMRPHLLDDVIEELSKVDPKDLRERGRG